MQTIRIHAACRTAFIAGALLLTATAWSANAPAGGTASQTEPSREMREKMATLHEQMAACLRSDKSLAQCRTDMMRGCQQAVGTQGCMAMGMGPGMRRGRMMPAAPTGQ